MVLNGDLNVSNLFSRKQFNNYSFEVINVKGHTRMLSPQINYYKTFKRKTKKTIKQTSL